MFTFENGTSLVVNICGFEASISASEHKDKRGIPLLCSGLPLMDLLAGESKISNNRVC